MCVCVCVCWLVTVIFLCATMCRSVGVLKTGTWNGDSLNRDGNGDSTYCSSQ